MPSKDFARSVAANLAFWLARSRELDDRTLHELDPERDNLFRAVRFGLGLSSTKCSAGDLILHIYTLIERRGYWRRWIPLLEEAVGGCGRGNRELSVRLLDRLGQCYRLDRRWDKSLTCHLREEGLARQTGDKLLLAKAHLNLSQTYWSQRQYEPAMAYGEEALLGFREGDGNAEQLGATTTILGLIALGRGKLATAEAWLCEAVEAYRSIERPALLARSLMNLAITLERGGRIEEAVVYCQEALAVLEPTEHELDKVRVELTLGTLYMHREQWSEAEAAYLRADSKALRRSGNAYLLTLAKNNLGSVYLALDRLDESEWALKKSIEMGRRSAGRLMLANSLGSMAETKLAMGHTDEALPFLDEAIAIAEEFPNDGWGREIVDKYSKLRLALER